MAAINIVEQTGFRLIKGQDINSIVSAVNGLASGTTTGTFTGTFNGAVGGTTPAAGAFTTASASSSVTARNALATPAAAAAVAAFTMGSAAIGIYFGTGSPSTVVTAAKGSLYIRADGSTTNDRLYVNTDGVTAWTNLTTAG